MIASGKYTAKDGQEKTSWVEVGVIMTSQAGKEFVLLDPCINLAGFPREAGKDKLIASIFDDANQQPRPSQQTSQYGTPMTQSPTPPKPVMTQEAQAYNADSLPF